MVQVAFGFYCKTIWFLFGVCIGLVFFWNEYSLYFISL